MLSLYTILCWFAMVDVTMLAHGFYTKVYVQLCVLHCNNQMCTFAIMLDYHSQGVHQVLTHVMLAGWSLWAGSLRPCWLD